MPSASAAFAVILGQEVVDHRPRVVRLVLGDRTDLHPRPRVTHATPRPTDRLRCSHPSRRTALGHETLRIAFAASTGDLPQPFDRRE